MKNIFIGIIPLNKVKYRVRGKNIAILGQIKSL